MKYDITPTLDKIDLGEWNPTAKGQIIYVWVDPPLDVLQERKAYSQDYNNYIANLAKTLKKPAKEKSARLEAGRQELQESQEQLDKFLKSWNLRVCAWYARLWSQGPEGTHWTAEELAGMAQQNPKLLAWLLKRSKELLDGYRSAEKRISAAPDALAESQSGQLDLVSACWKSQHPACKGEL
jgi:hypothetical protein